MQSYPGSRAWGNTEAARLDRWQTQWGCCWARGDQLARSRGWQRWRAVDNQSWKRPWGRPVRKHQPGGERAGRQTGNLNSKCEMSGKPAHIWLLETGGDSICSCPSCMNTQTCLCLSAAVLQSVSPSSKPALHYRQLSGGYIPAERSRLKKHHYHETTFCSYSHMADNRCSEAV